MLMNFTLGINKVILILIILIYAVAKTGDCQIHSHLHNHHQHVCLYTANSPHNSHITTIRHYTYKEAGWLTCIQRPVRQIQTFAFSHTAPLGNVLISSGLQCMCASSM